MQIILNMKVINISLTFIIVLEKMISMHLISL